MKKKLKILVNKIKSDGFGFTVKWLFRRRFRRLLPHRQLIWCTDLTEIKDDEFELPPNIEIIRYRSRDQIDKKDLTLLSEFDTELMGTNASNIIDQRFQKGAILWLIKKDNRLAGYRWTIVKDSLFPTYMPHTEADVHILGGELFKEFRGTGLMEIFAKHGKMTMKKEGYKRWHSEMYLWNKRAIGSKLKTSKGDQIGIARRFNFFGRNIVIWYDMVNQEKSNLFNPSAKAFKDKEN